MPLEVMKSLRRCVLARWVADEGSRFGFVCNVSTEFAVGVAE